MTQTKVRLKDVRREKLASVLWNMRPMKFTVTHVTQDDLLFIADKIILALPELLESC